MKTVENVNKILLLIRSSRVLTAVLCSVIVLFIVSCSSDDNTNPIKENPNTEMLVVPEGFPQPVFPEGNPYSQAKAELGRYLYYDRNLSKDSSIASCSHCLKQEFAFSDNITMSLGFDDHPEARNTMSHQNIVYRKRLFWDGRATMIEPIALRSIFLPYIMNTDTIEVVRRIEANPIYVAMFKKAFGDDVKITATLMAKAIATFVRVLITGDSPYDHYVNGDLNALNASQKRGYDIFFTDRGNCSKCHSGFLFTNEQFHNTGVVTHYFDRGRYEVTKKDEDRGKFLTPTLRNVELTPPYMHNGELASLEMVVNHYSNGGRAIIYKDTLIKPLNLSQQERSDLIAFLKALTDRKFVTNPLFSNPFKKQENN